MSAVPLKNRKYETFCQFVASGEMDYHAYIKAGFKESSAKGNAHKISSRQDVKDRINYLFEQKAAEKALITAEVSKKIGIDKEWVMTKLVEVHKAAMDGEPIVNGDGDIVGHKQNLPAACKALELVGKELGMFVVKVATDESDPLLALIRRVQGNSLPVVHDVSEIEDD